MGCYNPASLAYSVHLGALSRQYRVPSSHIMAIAQLQYMECGDYGGLEQITALDTLRMLCRFKSIPAFTANLTMENFQKQTRC